MMDSTFVRDSSFRSQTTVTTDLNLSGPSTYSRHSGIAAYSILRDRALARRVLFEDPDFPATDQSLKLGLKFDQLVEWKRPHEISKRPKFTGYAPDTSDVVPGQFGTSLFPAFCCLSLAPALLRKCIPGDQAFDEQYGGIFRFRFWRYGDWIELCIDDRLPTYNGRLMLMRNSDPNEFWAALMEKAYAKLNGSYAAIQSCNITWSLQDLTGGITDNCMFNDNPAMMQKVIDIAMARNTLIAATIHQPVGQSLRHLPNGLVSGRSYAVTGYAKISNNGSAILVRLRNPWRTPVWMGPWDNRAPDKELAIEYCHSIISEAIGSPLWMAVNDHLKQKLGYGNLAEGESWMPFHEFSRYFTMLEMCHLPPEAWNMEPKLKHRLPWKSIEAHRQWRRGFNAGGGTHSPLLSCNCQFYIELARPCCVVLSLMQKYRLLGEQRQFVPSELLIYPAPEGRTNCLDHGNFIRAKLLASTGLRAERDVVRFFQLTKGAYVILPVTARPGLEGRFCLRVYADDSTVIVRELDEIDAAASVQTERELDANAVFVIRRLFLMFCNKNEEIDAYDLQEILTSQAPGSKTRHKLCCGTGHTDSTEDDISLSPETCKAAITIVDTDMNGRLTYGEYIQLLQKLTLWQSIFRKYCLDKATVMDTYSLRNALKIAGFTVSNRTLEALVLRYAAKDNITLEGFVNSIIKLYVAHQRYATSIADTPAIGEREREKYLQELLRTAIYS